MYFAESAAVMFCLHTVAHEKKNLRSGSTGKFSGAFAPLVALVVAAYFVHARYARRKPPKI